ncbi:serine/threonine protein kinase [Corallococcus sp. H22C18031201]|nr:serine/threonine protein kinase [Corallococcus sp. H22C18031201]
MPIPPPTRSPARTSILFSVGATSYELIRHLGARGAGEVLLARRHYAEVPGGLVLIKRMRDPGHEHGREQLREETRLLMRLSHPAIPQVYLARVHAGALHLVTEYVEGHSLETLCSFAALRGQPLSEAFVAHVGAEVADALQHVHGLEDEVGRPLGAVHRDVSPRTLRVDSHGRVRVSDFALAWTRLAPHALEAQGPRCGDVAYAAPEALAHRPVDGRADLYSLGVVLLELLTGLHLLDLEDVERAARTAPPSLEQAPPRAADPSWLPASEMALRMACLTEAHVVGATRGLSSPMATVLRRVLRREPEARFQSGAQLRDALCDVLEGLGRPYGHREASREVSWLRRALGPAERWAAELVEQGHGPCA